jgi:protein-S-isoprenylcysteine O-methyltransferase Ste14
MDNITFHLLFVFQFLAFMGVRMVYYRKAQTQGGPIEEKEDRMTKIRQTLGLPFPILLLAYFVFPGLLSFAGFELSPGWRWAGVALGFASIACMWWVLWALDLNFNHILHVREQHTLIQHGPYRWVRHPMYTTHFMHGLSILLITANALIGGMYLLAFGLVVVFRIRNEEATMTDTFGDAYREYMERTGRFLPKFGSGLNSGASGES